MNPRKIELETEGVRHIPPAFGWEPYDGGLAPRLLRDGDQAIRCEEVADVELHLPADAAVEDLSLVGGEEVHVGLGKRRNVRASNTRDWNSTRFMAIEFDHRDGLFAIG